MREDGRRSGWILVLAVVVGMVLGAWLAFWVAGLAASAPSPGEPTGDRAPGADGEVDVDLLQVLLAFAPQPPMGLRVRAGELESGGYPKIFLVSLPTFPAHQRAFLFIRPADPALCRSLNGVELATYWQGAEPTALCAVGDPPGGESPQSAVEFFLRRSS